MAKLCLLCGTFVAVLFFELSPSPRKCVGRSSHRLYIHIHIRINLIRIAQVRDLSVCFQLDECSALEMVS